MVFAAVALGRAATPPPAETTPVDQAEPDPVVVEAEPEAEPEPEPELLTDIDALCVLPEVMPGSLDGACEAVSVEMDGFMQRGVEADSEARERWERAREVQLSMTIAQCMKVGSIEIAACQAHAMRRAAPELRGELPQLMMRCIERHAGS